MAKANFIRPVVLVESVDLLVKLIQYHGMKRFESHIVIITQSKPYPQVSVFDGLPFVAPVPLSGFQNIFVDEYNLRLCFVFGELEGLIPKINAQIEQFYIPIKSLHLRDYLRMANSEAKVHYYSEEEIELEAIDSSWIQKLQFQLVSSQKEFLGWSFCYSYELSSRFERLPRNRFTVFPQEDTVVVVGAGLAGAGAAWSLAQRGWKVKVCDPILVKGKSGAQKGHIAAAMTPVLTKDDDYKSRLSRHGVLLAHQLWRDFGQEVYQNCGTLELRRYKGHAKDLIETVNSQSLPELWVKSLDIEQGEVISNYPVKESGVLFSYGKLVLLEALLERFLTHENIELFSSQINSFHRKSNQLWEVEMSSGERLQAGVLVLANGLGAKQLIEESCQDRALQLKEQDAWSLMCAMGGEVAYAPVSALEAHPKMILGSEGYFLPEQKGYHVLGSTYVYKDLEPHVTTQGQAKILEKMIFSEKEKQELRKQLPLEGWAGSRVVRPGRLPLITPVYPSDSTLWLLGAYASHGLTWATLGGELIATVLKNEPLLIEQDLWAALLLS